MRKNQIQNCHQCSHFFTQCLVPNRLSGGSKTRSQGADSKRLALPCIDFQSLKETPRIANVLPKGSFPLAADGPKPSGLRPLAPQNRSACNLSLGISPTVTDARECRWMYARIEQIPDASARPARIGPSLPQGGFHVAAR